MSAPEQERLNRLVALPDNGANRSDDKGKLYLSVDKILTSWDDLSFSYLGLDPTVWTEFIVEYAAVLQEGRIDLPATAVHTARMIQNSLLSLADIEEATNEQIAKTNAPPKFKNLLPTLKNELVVRRCRQNALANASIDVCSRLWIKRRSTIEGEIERIEYIHDTVREVVWQMGEDTDNPSNLEDATPLPEFQKLEDLNTDPLKLDFFDSEIQEQFDDVLLTELVAQVNGGKATETLQRILDLSAHGGNQGEMVFQQAVYPFIALAMLAAASNRYAYVADQEVLGSAFVYDIQDAGKYGVLGKPHSGLVMQESEDLIAILEFKPEEELNQQDLAKCILWSTLAGQGLVRAGVPREDVKVPFLIGSGKNVSLFVTEFKHEVDEFCPTVTGMMKARSLLVEKERKKVLIALVVLLGRLKTKIGMLTGEGVALLSGRRKSKREISKNVLSKRQKSDDIPPSRRAASSTDAPDQMDTKSGTKPPGETEKLAMGALAKLHPKLVNVAYPWERIRSIFGGDDHIFYQQSSPFYFRGESGRSPVFCKVWRQGDDYVDEVSIEREVDLLRHASKCDVLVPSVYSFGKVQSGGALFFVLLMSDAGHKHYVNTHDELLSYGTSLIEYVSKLHSKARLLHCDLKPQNVIWNGMDAIVLDFGHAQKIGEVSPVPGTDGFEAPEVKRGEVNTTSTDAFSVGKLLLTVMGRATDKCKKLQHVAEGLCMSDVRHRMSLQDALNKLILTQNDGRDLHSLKKAKILTMNCAEGCTLSPSNAPLFITTKQALSSSCGCV